MVGYHDIMILAVLHDTGTHELGVCEVRPDSDDLSISSCAASENQHPGIGAAFLYLGSIIGRINS